VTEKLEASLERVTVTVRPSGAHPSVLSVQDAMRQVLDFFELLTPEEQDGAGLVWNLKSASTNSPLTVVGEATSLDQAIDVSVIARTQRQAVSEQLRSFVSGARPAKAISKKRRDTFNRMFARNTNGIGITDAVFGLSGESISITPTSALAGISALAQDENEFSELVLAHRGREEIGSIEGVLLQVGTDYNQPAILVRERKTGAEIWCRVDAQLKHKISSEARFEDVWDHKRVMVRGRISFDTDGAVIRVRANSVAPMEPRSMTIHDIKDASFTDGLRVHDYLNRLREGELG
jgi:hypothetical protein